MLYRIGTQSHTKFIVSMRTRKSVSTARESWTSSIENFYTFGLHHNWRNGKESLMYHSRLAQLIAKEKKEKNHPCFAKSCVCCVNQRPLFRSILDKSRCISKQRDWCGFENSFSLAKYRIRASFQQFGLFMA